MYVGMYNSPVSILHFNRPMYVYMYIQYMYALVYFSVYKIVYIAPFLEPLKNTVATCSSSFWCYTNFE